AVTGAGPSVFRVPEMEAALAKSFTPDAIKDIAIKDDGLNSDIHASAEHRAHLVNEMARRALHACAQVARRLATPGRGPAKRTGCGYAGQAEFLSEQLGHLTPP